jgi:transcriptional regulator with XRE-family HTH domain
MAAPRPPLVALGRNVRSLREKKKLTQEALGERAELHTTYISDIERGMRNPSALILLRLAKGLGADAGDLFKGVKL